MKQNFAISYSSLYCECKRGMLISRRYMDIYIMSWREKDTRILDKGNQKAYGSHWGGQRIRKYD